jgi:hypothetical protein
MRRLEEEREHHLNRRKKIEFRRLLDNFSRMKAIQLAKHMEEEHELNRNIINEYFRLNNEDENSKSARKVFFNAFSHIAFTKTPLSESYKKKSKSTKSILSNIVPSWRRRGRRLKKCITGKGKRYPLLVMQQ